jgi:hypothetical protein
VLFGANIVIFGANAVIFRENTVLFGANAMHSTVGRFLFLKGPFFHYGTPLFFLIFVDIF